MLAEEPLRRKAQRTPSVRLRFGKREDPSVLENEVIKCFLIVFLSYHNPSVIWCKAKIVKSQSIPNTHIKCCQHFSNISYI